MRKKLLILLCTMILISSSSFASYAKITSTVDRDEELYSAKIGYLGGVLLGQYSAGFTPEYAQYKNQITTFGSYSSNGIINFDQDDLRNNNVYTMLNGTFFLMITGLNESNMLTDRFFDVILYPGEFYKINSDGTKTYTGIKVIGYSTKYKMMTAESDGTYIWSGRTYKSAYDNTPVLHWYVGWQGSKDLEPGIYQADIKYNIIDQS